jgi:hypothetical protein
MKELKRGAIIRLLFEGMILLKFGSRVKCAFKKFMLSIYSIHHLILNFAVLKLHMAAL